ncbi:ATP-binding protein [Sinimarinibacterium sp. CAU 1509]|uniref:AAA family ATPase n=1 Tax=Sinimarinibacterium sp. CAU 1509 TaxID=2562283 RepID=UPI0010ABB102|nr:AAA family ATPase [Sinimarinibacterium sp. CAU 1509]TJY59427.1 ATP-binding protein [Sinimarinibacterium sp. CAU 1509]
MDPRINPYAPGAGAPPPELAGRDQVIEAASIALDRMRNGLVARSLMLVGLRGVGKTVLLNRLHNDAEASGFATVVLEAPEQRSLPALLVPSMRAVLLKLDRMAAGGDLAKRALRALGGFVQAMKLKYGDIEFGLDLGLEPGVADTGDLDADLISLFQVVGEAARERKTVLVLFVDELQYVPEPQLAALITALHRCAQLQLPVTMIGAGLPQLLGQMGRAKSYAERLFEFTPIGKLPDAAARQALAAPAQRAGVLYEEAALHEILRQTEGYPYFLQEWGKHSWTCAQQSPITLADVHAATDQALAELDASFFRVRLDRLTPSEKRYLRAMAELGPGPHRSGDIAHTLGREVATVAPTRAKLIDKGMVFSPAHGDTGFTVPLFDAYMRRVMPDWP